MYEHCWKGEESISERFFNIDEHLSQQGISEEFQEGVKSSRCSKCGEYFGVHEFGCPNIIDERITDEDLEF